MLSLFWMLLTFMVGLFTTLIWFETCVHFSKLSTLFVSNSVKVKCNYHFQLNIIRTFIEMLWNSNKAVCTGTIVRLESNNFHYDTQRGIYSIFMHPDWIISNVSRVRLCKWITIRRPLFLNTQFGRATWWRLVMNFSLDFNLGKTAGGILEINVLAYWLGLISDVPVPIAISTKSRRLHCLTYKLYI